MTRIVKRKSANPISNRQSFTRVTKSSMSHVIYKINLFVEGESDVNFYKSLKVLNEDNINIQELKELPKINYKIQL